MSTKHRRIYRVNLALTSNELTALALISELQGTTKTTTARTVLMPQLRSGIIKNWEILKHRGITDTELTEALG